MLSSFMEETVKRCRAFTNILRRTQGLCRKVKSLFRMVRRHKSALRTTLFCIKFIITADIIADKALSMLVLTGTIGESYSEGTGLSFQIDL